MNDMIEVMDILESRYKNLKKQKNILISELSNPDNLNSDFIIRQSKLLLQVEYRLNELETIILLVKSNK